MLVGPLKTCHSTHPASIFHFHMLAGARFHHDFEFIQHFLKQNAGWLASPAKKINPASISAQPMLAGPRKLAAQPFWAASKNAWGVAGFASDVGPPAKMLGESQDFPCSWVKIPITSFSWVKLPSTASSWVKLPSISFSHVKLPKHCLQLGDFPQHPPLAVPLPFP